MSEKALSGEQIELLRRLPQWPESIVREELPEADWPVLDELKNTGLMDWGYPKKVTEPNVYSRSRGGATLLATIQSIREQTLEEVDLAAEQLVDFRSCTETTLRDGERLTDALNRVDGWVIFDDEDCGDGLGRTIAEGKSFTAALFNATKGATND